MNKSERGVDGRAMNLLIRLSTRRISMRPLNLAIAGEVGKQFRQVEADFPEEVAQIALAILRVHGEKFLRWDIERIIPNQRRYHQ